MISSIKLAIAGCEPAKKLREDQISAKAAIKKKPSYTCFSNSVPTRLYPQLALPEKVDRWWILQPVGFFPHSPVSASIWEMQIVFLGYFTRED
jgi:hypothetical protein